jgi:hypothetical protein
MLDPFAAVECGRKNGFVYLRHSPTPVACGLIEVPPAAAYHKRRVGAWRVLKHVEPLRGSEL